MKLHTITLVIHIEAGDRPIKGIEAAQKLLALPEPYLGPYVLKTSDDRSGRTVDYIVDADQKITRPDQDPELRGTE